jgi:hypothetical protein
MSINELRALCYAAIVGERMLPMSRVGDRV